MRDVLVSGWLLSCTLHFVVTRACTTFCRTYCIPLQISPKKFEKHAFYAETLRRKNGTALVSKPINWIWSCAPRSFLLPHSSCDCSSKSPKSLRRAFVDHACKSIWYSLRLCKPFLHYKMVPEPPPSIHRMLFVVSQHWLLIHHQKPQSIL